MAGFYAGLCMATCIGLFLFTRILIPDVDADLHHRAGDVGLSCGCSMKRNAHPRAWAYTLAASLGVGLLLKSLIALVFP